MAGIKGQGKIQRLILRELDRVPLLSLRELNPDGNRSRQKALRRSTTKLVQSGVLVRIKVVVPSSPIPSIHSLVARCGTCILGIPTVVRTDIVEPVAEPAEMDSEAEIPMTLTERIERLQERIG